MTEERQSSTNCLCSNFSDNFSDLSPFLSKIIYSQIYKLNEGDLFHSTWISSVKNILDSARISGIWTNQSLPESPDHLNKILKLMLHDQFIKKWNDGITQGGKCAVYRIIKNTYSFEKYLIELPLNNRISMTKFRCHNHRLTIESGCRAQRHAIMIRSVSGRCIDQAYSIYLRKFEILFEVTSF